MRGFCFTLVLSLPFLGGTKAEAVLLNQVEVIADDSVNRARVDDLLDLPKGREFSQSEVVKGLSRVAATGVYKRVEATFDTKDGKLVISIEPLDQVTGIEILISDDIKRDYQKQIEDDLREALPVRIGANIQVDSIPTIRARLLARMKERGYPDPSLVVALQDGKGNFQKTLLISVNPGNREYLDGFELGNFTARDLRVLKDELSEFSGFESIFPELRVKDSIADYPEEYLLKNFRFNQKVKKTPEIRSMARFPLDWVSLNQALANWSAQARSAGYYELRYAVDVVQRDDKRLLKIELNSGPRYRVQIQGNVFFWERDLRGQILDKTLRLGVPLNLQEAQNQLLLRYRQAGFADVKVDYEAVQSGDGVLTINLVVDEGRRYFLSEVLWDGLSTDEILLVRPLVDRWRSELAPASRLYYSEDAVTQWIEQLSGILKENGFLSLRVLGHRAIRRKDSPAIDLELSAQIGARYKIRDVIVSGRPLLPSTEIRKAILLKRGDWANLEKILRSGERIKSFHEERGFVNCEVSRRPEEIIRFSDMSDEVDLNYTVDPGPEVRLGKVIVEGLERTQEVVVLREFETHGMKKASVWNPKAAQETEGSLLGLGIFSSIKREPVGGRLLNRAEDSGSPVDSIERDLKVTVYERPAGALEFGPGFRTDLGIAAFSEFNYRNLWGMNRSLFIRAQISRKINEAQYLFPEQKYSISYLEPYFWQQPLRFRITSKYSKEDKRTFDSSGPEGGFAQREFSIKFLLEKDFGIFRLSQGLYSLDFPEVFNIVKSKGVARRYRIASIDTFLSSDTRDNLFNPTRGHYWSGNIEYAAPAIGSGDDVHYYLASTQISGYFTPIRQVTFAGWLSASHIQSVGSVDSIPESKRLFVGGRGSVRSLPEKGLRYDQAVVGRQNVVEGKIEYRQAFLADLGVAFFLDGGQIWAKDYRSLGFRRGIGSGLRYQTPVGPLSLDLAINLDRKAGEDGSRILFSVGNL